MSDTPPQPPEASEPASSPLDRAERGHSRVLWVGAAVAVHAALLAGAALVPDGERERPTRRAALVSQMMEVQLEPPEPEPEAEPEAPEPEAPEPTPPPVRKRAKPAPQPARAPEEPPPEAPEPTPAPEAPAPEAAEAAEVLTADSDAPADFDHTIVSGKGDTPAGGASAAGGTAQQPVRSENARADGVEGGTGKAPAPTVDRSRPPRLAGGARWDCPFPREADFAGVDSAAVILGVKVGRDGTMQSVTIHDDPGNGFGREARRCAMRKRWDPALDESGQPVERRVHIRVRFTR